MFCRPACIKNARRLKNQQRKQNESDLESNTRSLPPIYITRQPHRSFDRGDICDDMYENII